MKKYFAYIAFAALVFAVSCNKEEINTTVETELITVEINPEVKTSLSGVNTEWTAGDAVSVTVAGKNIGTLTLVDGNTFSGEIEAGHNGNATLNYPAGVTEVPATQAAVANSFANGAALLEGTTTMAALRAGEGATLSNKTALLQFSVAQAGDVTFEVGATKYTVTGCETGKTYYACIAPASNVSLVARIGGYLSKAASSNKTFEANEISELSSLPAPVKSEWGVVGLNGNWNTDVAMYKDVSGYSVAKNVTIKSTDEFKFRVGNWAKEIAGGLTAPDTKRANNTSSKANITMSAEGTYDLYTDGSNYYVMTPGQLPGSATSPSAITITISSVDKSYKCLHMWGAVSLNCKYNSGSTWTVSVPADKLNDKVRVILTKGNGDNQWSNQTSDSDELCMRNPMELKVTNNKATHK